MGAVETFSILTSFERDGSRLVLRLDTDGQGLSGENGRALVLTLENCSDASVVEGELREWVGKPVEYMAEAGSVWLSIDDGWEEREILCDGRTEVEVDLTVHDLHVRSRHLAHMANTYRERSFQVSARLGSLRDEVSLEVTRGLDRARRKADFFQQSNPVREAAAASEIKVYERIQRLLDKPDSESAA